MNKSVYLTTPLYYVNAKPHIGHAYTNIVTDTFARFFKLTGSAVYFLTGTDEHGTKIEKIAKDQHQTPRDFVDSMVPFFKDLWKLLGIEYDDFIRTTEERHQKVVAQILIELEKKGDIYRSKYEGWYCTPCESFWTQLQLVEAKCPDCHREVQRLEEENYFFKLAHYQSWLQDYIQAHPNFIQPEMRKNEILGFLKEPLEDLCITRPRARLEWGIPYPTSKDHVVYVWFDALINYISAIAYGVDSQQFKSCWPADIHFVGKDILRQHAVYWPIMLKSIGLEMPLSIVAHGWWTMAGAKVSKSRGNAVDPEILVSKYGVDAFRYYLLREVKLGYDGAFSEDLFRERYTTDLANDLGNLWSRTASMLDKYFQGRLPDVTGEYLKAPLFLKSSHLWKQVSDAMNQWDPREALDQIFAVVTQANQFIEESKPWVLAKDPQKKEALGLVLVTLAECVVRLAMNLLPFLPKTASEILNRMGYPIPHQISELNFEKALLKSGSSMIKGEILFPKLLEEGEEPPKAG